MEDQLSAESYNYPMLRKLEILNRLALIFLMAVSLGCPPRTRKPRYAVQYELYPFRNTLNIEDSVYDGAKCTGTVTELICNEDSYYLIVEFTEENEVKNSKETIIQQSKDGRLFFQKKL